MIDCDCGIGEDQTSGILSERSGGCHRIEFGLCIRKPFRSKKERPPHSLDPVSRRREARVTGFATRTRSGELDRPTDR